MAQSLIVTAAFFWDADRVEWGARGKKGKLLGVLSTRKSAKPIDFSDQVGVYALYADYQMVYAGQTGRSERSGQALLKRLRSHRSDDLAGRWNRFSWFGVRRVLKNGKLSKKNAAFHPSLEDVLDQVEGILIHAAEPPLNRQRGRLKKKVERYLQN